MGVDAKTIEGSFGDFLFPISQNNRIPNLCQFHFLNPVKTT